MTNQSNLIVPKGRLLSLDFFRGFTMFMLIAEGTHLFQVMVAPQFEGTIISFIGTQLDHHPWHGLRFWDLIQPFFMFIVGVAMPFSFEKRWQRGDSWKTTLKHAMKRSFLLLFLGWALYCIGPGRITFELWNVLAQLSFTYLVAFLMMRKPVKTQIIFSLGMIIITEILYRTWPVHGFNHPFTPDQNFGSWVDLLIMRKIQPDHWVAFNAVPTTAHTMWGVLAGILLKSDKKDMQKVKILVIAGLIGIIAGYSLDPVTPIIKRICTSSFVLVSGGWALVALAFSYWLVDMKKVRRVPKFFEIVGMNPLFIYLFSHTRGTSWIYGIVKPFSFGLFGWMGQIYAQLFTGAIVWFCLWYICYWLYKRRIFIKI